MVVTVASLTSKNASYYVKGYYLNGQAEGEWLDTEGARNLKLAGKEVRPRDFERLLRGFHPQTEEALVQNAGDKNRQLGWDLQFAVDKSFSVLYGLLPEAREELERSLKDAVKRTLIEVFEPQFLETRRGRGGKIREPVSSPIAIFLHRTNRENEIHIHCHAPVPNVGIREDGTAGTIVSWNFYDGKLALGKAFHANFVEQVRARLGIECEIDSQGLSRVRGFPELVAGALSTPSAKIAEVAKDQTAKAKEEANLKIRPAKAEQPLDMVTEECARRAESLGFTADDARSFLGRATPVQQVEGEEAARALLKGVISAMPEEFSKAQLFEQAFREGAKAELPFAAVNQALKETLSSGAELTSLGRINGREQYRKAREFDAGPGPRALKEAHEEELRKLLGEIINATPELNVAEFLPSPTAQEPESALSEHDEAVRKDERVEKAAEFGIRDEDLAGALASLDLPRRVQERVLEELNTDSLRKIIEARSQDPLDPTEQRTARDASPVETTSVDTRSPKLDAHSKVHLEQERAEARFVNELKEAHAIPEEQARSLFRGVLDRARDRTAERFLDSAITKALEDITKREAHFTRDGLREEVETRLSGRIIPFYLQEARIDHALNDPGRVVTLGESNQVRRYTTPEMLHVEELGIRAAEALQKHSGHAEKAHEVRQKLEDLPTPERNAVAKALSGSDLVLLEGKNGQEMQAVQRGINEALKKNLVERGIENMLLRKDLLWVAPTATAARELERSVGARNVLTVEKFLHEVDRGVGETMKHYATMLVHAAVGLPYWAQSHLPLTPHTTVVLDSASLVDTRQFSRLLQHAERAGARVIACATHEMPPLGPGGFFKELRQRSQEACVVTLPGAAKTDVEVVAHAHPAEAKTSLIDHWAKAAMKTPKDHTIVAASSRDVHELNQMAQARRKEAGELGLRSLTVRYKLGGEVVKERIYEGDRVVFTARTDKEVINGVFGTVKNIDLITGRIKVALDLKEKTYLPWEFDRQKTIEFQYRKYLFFRRQEEGFRLGYAATIYRTQNVAVEGNAYCLLGGPRGAPSAVYAGLGLAKGTTYFFGNRRQERAALLKEKQTAHEVKRRAEEELRNLRLLKEGLEQAGRHAMEQRQGQGMGMGF
jgi:conjugative relaxase-like TrwC/TraI family protein